MSDYEQSETPWHETDAEGGSHEHQQPSHEQDGGSPEGHSDASKPKRKGPRKMVEQPTQRFEGQMYAKQYEQATQVMNRLKREKRAVPSEERRRLTINSLVRVAMTVLLEHRSALKGTTEEELLEQFRASLTTQRGEGES